MKTLLFTLEYPPFKGGIANYYGNLAKYWPKAGEFEILNNNQGQLLNSLPLGWFKAVFKLRRAVKAENIDHVLVGQILPLGLAALIGAKFFKIKYSVILHGLDFTSALKISRKKFISRKILTQAKKIICANGYTAELVKQTFPKLAAKVIVVDPGVESLSAYNSQLATQLEEEYNLSDQIVLLSVGRLVKRKGFDYVIRALPPALEQAPNLIYIIIGDGPELKNYQQEIASHNLKNKVIIINQATDQERDVWYGLSDIFIMPARNIAGDFEGFGIVYLEANLAGKPVIAGRSGGAGEAVEDGLNGLMVDPEDINDISEKILKLALNPELRQKLGQAGKERAIKNFNWQKQAEKIYNIIL